MSLHYSTNNLDLFCFLFLKINYSKSKKEKLKKANCNNFVGRIEYIILLSTDSRWHLNRFICRELVLEKSRQILDPSKRDFFK